MSPFVLHTFLLQSKKTNKQKNKTKQNKTKHNIKHKKNKDIVRKSFMLFLWELQEIVTNVIIKKR